jgi:hypothetical protein
LLVRSIRTFAGRYRDAPIHTFSPRANIRISEFAREALAGLGVIHHDDPLNVEFADYPIGNKVFVCDHAEATLAEEVLVFLDSDTIMVGEPVDLDLRRTEGVNVALRPAYSRDLNSTGPGDPRDAYWQGLHRFLKIEAEPYVLNELDERVRGYFSSGLVAARREAGVFARWKADFLTLVRAGLLPRPGEIGRMDEVALACTLARDFDRVRVLGGRYNYLIYKRPRLPLPFRNLPLGDLIHIHYRYWFQRPNFLEDIRPSIPADDRVVRWLAPFLPLEPIRLDTSTFPFEGPESS